MVISYCRASLCTFGIIWIILHNSSPPSKWLFHKIVKILKNSKIGIFFMKNEIFSKWLQMLFIDIKWHHMAVERPWKRVWGFTSLWPHRPWASNNWLKQWFWPKIVGNMVIRLQLFVPVLVEGFWNITFPLIWAVWKQHFPEIMSRQNALSCDLAVLFNGPPYPLTCYLFANRLSLHL